MAPIAFCVLWRNYKAAVPMGTRAAVRRVERERMWTGAVAEVLAPFDDRRRHAGWSPRPAQRPQGSMLVVALQRQMIKVPSVRSVEE